MQLILIRLVRDLKDALQDKKPEKFVPSLQNAIKNLADVLSQLKFNPLIRMDTGISKEIQELVNVLSTSPSNIINEVNTFIQRRMNDIQNLYMSHKFIKDKFGNQVNINFKLYVEL